MTLDDEAHRAIGHVVANGQYFESAFLMCAKLALTHDSATALADVRPLSLSKSFKQATQSVLKELRGHVELDPAFESKLTLVIERRHELIHRWLLNRGWPVSTDSEGLTALLEYANQLSIEMNALTRLLVETIVAWLRRFPETSGSAPTLGPDWRANLPPEYRSLVIRKSE